MAGCQDDGRAEQVTDESFAGAGGRVPETRIIFPARGQVREDDWDLVETIVREEWDYLRGMDERIDECGVRLEIAVTGTVAKKAVKCGR